MKKRLRKKLHRGEFQELGFALSFQLATALSTSDRNQLIADFVRDAIEPHDLAFAGGGMGDTWEGFASIMAGRTATEAGREHVRRWLAAEPRLVAFAVGPLVDANDLDA
jgi:uncharacterized protein YggL (DUF469 family)